MKTGIVDVGGGMRGIYAAGIFDWCLKQLVHKSFYKKQVSCEPAFYIIVIISTAIRRQTYFLYFSKNRY